MIDKLGFLYKPVFIGAYMHNLFDIMGHTLAFILIQFIHKEKIANSSFYFRQNWTFNIKQLSKGNVGNRPPSFNFLRVRMAKKT
jgi:hypothetical protein